MENDHETFPMKNFEFKVTQKKKKVDGSKNIRLIRNQM